MGLILANHNPLLGYKVSRAAADLPQSTSETLFTVTGFVLVTALAGRITTAVQSGAFNTKLETAAGDITSNTDISSQPDTVILSIAESVGSSLQIGNTRMGSQGIPDSIGWYFRGPLDVDLTTDANKTGQIRWDLWYWPLEEGATVAAA